MQESYIQQALYESKLMCTGIAIHCLTTVPSGDTACCSQVARRTFIRALNDRGSVILVPGGQAELIHTGRLRSKKEFVIYPKHQGVNFA